MDLVKREIIKIRMAIQSRNRIDKMHWREKSRLRKLYQVFIRSQMSIHRIPQADMDSRYKLRIKTFRKRRIRDLDNLIGGAKQLIDALVHENFIWDDNTDTLVHLEIGQGSPEQGMEEYTLVERIQI